MTDAALCTHLKAVEAIFAQTFKGNEVGFG
jgi:hypothetical protein